jgi:hypothetical protein
MSNASAQHCDPFSRSAAIYDRVHAGSKDYDAHARIAMSFMRQSFPAGQRPFVIEWGAGTGEFTRRLMQECEVLAFEPDNHMRAVAASKGIKTIKGDVRYTAFPPAADAQCLLFATFSYACITDNDIDRAMTNLRIARTGKRPGESQRPCIVFDCVNYAAAHAALFDHDRVSPCGTVQVISRKSFDFTTSILACENTYRMLPDGAEWVEVHKMRAFTPPEITSHLRRHGFVVRNFFDPENGGTCIKHCPFYFGVHAEAV